MAWQPFGHAAHRRQPPLLAGAEHLETQRARRWNGLHQANLHVRPQREGLAGTLADEGVVHLIVLVKIADH